MLTKNIDIETDLRGSLDIRNVRVVVVVVYRS